jgi:hypothetical protein
MKKSAYGLVLAGMCVLTAFALAPSTAVPAYAQRGGGGGHGGGGHMGGAPGGGWHGGSGGWQGGGGGWHGGSGGWHGGGGSWQGGGGSWHGGSWHGGTWNRGWGWRGGWGGWWWGPSVVVGAPFWGWYPYGYPYGYGYGYPYPYPYPYGGYAGYSPPAVVDSGAQTYIQQDTQAQQQYWYYCQNPQGYYPYVSECPGGWQAVSPQPPPPAR